jgi:hypothetical protein
MPADVIRFKRRKKQPKYPKYLCLYDHNGDMHLIPVKLACQWAAGHQPMPDARVLRRIVTEWLYCLASGCVQHVGEEHGQS